jgi:hypothetical protein
MALTTGGTTYVTSTDLVANYPTASLALANRVDVVASGGPNSIKTSGYTITLADILGGNKFLYNSASPGTFTLPTSSLVDGMVVNVAQIGAGALTVSGGTIVGTTVTTAQYQGLSFVYVTSGATWYSIAPNATAPGLAIISPTSIANSGGSASASGGAVTFTGVTSLSLNGVFNSTYDNYRVVIAGTVSSGSLTSMQLRLRAAGTDNSGATAYSYGGGYIGVSAVGFETGSSGASSIISTRWVSTTRNITTIDIASPAMTVATNLTVLSGGVTNGFTFFGYQDQATSYDGITFYPSAGTASGVVRVYGYRN